MTREQREAVEKNLINFIERASAEKALPEEVQVLPAVVDALVGLMNA